MSVEKFPKKILSLQELAEYHTALMLLEQNFLETKAKDDIRKILQDFPGTLEVSPAVKEIILKDLNLLKIEITKDELQKKQRSAYEYGIEFAVIARQTRKEYDQDYFRMLLNGNISNLDTAQAFLDLIRENDAPYYNTAVATLLNCFQELPKTLGYSDKPLDGIYKLNSYEDLQKIQGARKILNQVFAASGDFPRDYWLEEKKEEVPKTWGERKFNRILFHGVLKKVTKQNNKTKKFKDISWRTAFMMSPSPAQDDLEKIKQAYSDPNTEGYTNAQNLIMIFEHVMQKRRLENAPFPILINAVCEELGEDKNAFMIKEYVPNKDRNGDTYYAYKYVVNRRWENYCQDNNLSGYRPMERSIKHQYLQYILHESKDATAYRNAICDAVENCLVNFCDANDLNSDIVIAAFGRLKYDENGNINQAGYNHLYNILFESPTKRKDENNNGKSRNFGPLFHTEVHHDRERIMFSNKPNTKDNFILTINANKDLGYAVAYEKLLNLLELLSYDHMNNENLENALKDYEFYKRCRKKKDPFSFHNDILHGADVSISLLYNGASKNVLHYFITPIRPKENDAGNPDNYIVAMIDTNYIITDRAKGNSATSYNQYLRARERVFGRA